MSVKGKTKYLFLSGLRVNSPHNIRVTQLIVNELCRHGEFQKLLCKVSTHSHQLNMFN